MQEQQPYVFRKKILIVERDFLDEMRIALEGRDSKVRSMPIRDQTIAVLQGSDVEAAILDWRLDRALCVQIADALVSLGIPFVLTDAHEPALLPGHLAVLNTADGAGELELIAQRIFGPPTYH